MPISSTRRLTEKDITPYSPTEAMKSAAAPKAAKSDPKTL
jgi:hypothetical protein